MKPNPSPLIVIWHISKEVAEKKRNLFNTITNYKNDCEETIHVGSWELTKMAAIPFSDQVLYRKIIKGLGRECWYFNSDTQHSKASLFLK